MLASSERNGVLSYRPTPRETVTPEIAAELERRHASTGPAHAVRRGQARGAS